MSVHTVNQIQLNLLSKPWVKFIHSRHSQVQEHLVYSDSGSVATKPVSKRCWRRCVALRGLQISKSQTNLQSSQILPLQGFHDQKSGCIQQSYTFCPLFLDFGASGPPLSWLGFRFECSIRQEARVKRLVCHCFVCAGQVSAVTPVA